MPITLRIQPSQGLLSTFFTLVPPRLANCSLKSLLEKFQGSQWLLLQLLLVFSSLLLYVDTEHLIQLKVVLDEIASGQGKVNFRVNTYMPVYSEILGLMSKCDTSLVHCAKTMALRRRWAQLGRYAAHRISEHHH